MDSHLWPQSDKMHFETLSFPTVSCRFSLNLYPRLKSHGFGRYLMRFFFSRESQNDKEVQLVIFQVNLSARDDSQIWFESSRTKTLFLPLVIVEIAPNALLEHVSKSDRKTVSKGRTFSNRNQALLDFWNMLEELRR